MRNLGWAERKTCLKWFMLFTKLMASTFGCQRQGAEPQSSWEQFEKHKEHSVDRQAPPHPISSAPHWSQPPQQPPTCVPSIHSYLALNDQYDPLKRLKRPHALLLKTPLMPPHYPESELQTAPKTLWILNCFVSMVSLLSPFLHPFRSSHMGLLAGN